MIGVNHIISPAVPGGNRGHPGGYGPAGTSRPRCRSHSSARRGQSEAVPKSGFMHMPCAPC